MIPSLIDISQRASRDPDKVTVPRSGHRAAPPSIERLSPACGHSERAAIYSEVSVCGCTIQCHHGHVTRGMVRSSLNL